MLHAKAVAAAGLCCLALTACGPAGGDGDGARATGGGDPGAGSTSLSRSGALFSSADATTSCVETYSPAAVPSRAFAFDGEVVAMGPSVSNYSDGANLDVMGVTFTVPEWFAGHSGDTFTVDMLPPDQGSDASSENGPAYAVGSRLLVSGEPRWGGRPEESPIAWTCGFTRYYDQETADQWRAAARCADAQLLRVALDVTGPGKPSPAEAVAPHAGTLDLASRVVDGQIVVIGLRQDGSIVRTYDVTERADGWWPDGYSECRA